MSIKNKLLASILLFIVHNTYAFDFPSSLDTGKYPFFITDTEIYLLYPKLTGGYSCQVLAPAIFNTLQKGKYDTAGKPIADNLKNYIETTVIPPAPTAAQQDMCNQLAIPPNLPPAANDKFSVIDKNVVLNSNVMATDPNNDPLAYSVNVAPLNGTLILSITGTFVYTPALDYTGADSFKYVVNDGKIDSNIATVSITINNPPPPPTGFAVFVCTKAGVSGLFDCAWWSQIILKDPANVTATDPILRCTKGWTGKSNMELCAPKFVTKGALTNTDSVGVCFGKKGGDTPNTCGNPGGEGFEKKTSVFP